MSKQYGRSIALIIWIIWFGALQGKKIFPAVFGSSEFQWSCAAIVAVLIPIGTLIALRRYCRPDQRRSGLGLLIACVFPLVVNLTTYGVGGPLMARTVVLLSAMNDRDAEMIAKVARQAVEPEQLNQRKKAAWELYTLFGVRSAWRDSSGELSIYNPTKEEEASWWRTKDTNSKLAASTNLLDSQLKQFPWLFALNFGCFTSILFGGLVWQTYKQRSEQDVHGNTH